VGVDEVVSVYPSLAQTLTRAVSTSDGCHCGRGQSILHSACLRGHLPEIRCKFVEKKPIERLDHDWQWGVRRAIFQQAQRTSVHYTAKCLEEIGCLAILPARLL